MAGRAKPLTARAVETIKTPGRHADGGNLYLNVTATGARSWVFMWAKGGRQREMGLGPARDVSLAEARDLATQHRRTIRAGGDPLEARRTAIAKPTFAAFAEQHIVTMEKNWRNPKHRAQWRSTLNTYATLLNPLLVDQVATADVLAVLKPIWSTKPETASRVRGRIEAVLDAAKAAGLREGDNPAAWRGHLDQLLPRRSRASRGHHAAMPIDDVPAFKVDLRAAAGVSPRALEFTILTAARSGEVLGATWGEIDLEKRIWTVPAGRMKGEREHRVPLVSRAVEILGEMQAARLSENTLRQAVPEYGTALETAAQPIQARNALEFGSEVLRPTVPRDVAAETISHMTGPELEQVRQGLRSTIFETMGNVQRTITDPNVDARQAMSLVKQLSSDAAREKMALIVGDREAGTIARGLEQSLTRATRAQELRGSVANNSRTAGRLMTDEAVKAATASPTLDAILGLQPQKTFGGAVQAVFGRSPAAIARQQDQVYGDLARTLTGPRGQAASGILDQLLARDAGRARAANINGAIPYGALA